MKEDMIGKISRLIMRCIAHKHIKARVQGWFIETPPIKETLALYTRNPGGWAAAIRASTPQDPRGPTGPMALYTSILTRPRSLIVGATNV
jgi:hypothetical protein